MKKNLERAQEAMRLRSLYQAVGIPTAADSPAKSKFQILSDLSLGEAVARNNKLRREEIARKKRLRHSFRDQSLEPAISGLNSREKFIFEKFYSPGVRAIRRGWPDLCFVKNGRAICVEVKSVNDPLSPVQIETLSILLSLGFEVRVLIVDFADAGGAR